MTNNINYIVVNTKCNILLFFGQQLLIKKIFKLASENNYNIKYPKTFNKIMYILNNILYTQIYIVMFCVTIALHLDVINELKQNI